MVEKTAYVKVGRGSDERDSMGPVHQVCQPAQITVLGSYGLS